MIRENIPLSDLTAAMRNQPSHRYRVIVKSQYDADTFRGWLDLGCNVWLTGKKNKGEGFRLIGIDTPEVARSKQTTKAKREKEHAMGREARDYIRGLVAIESDLVVETFGKDKYGRWLSRVWIPGGPCLNELLIVKGHAVEYDGGTRLYPV